MKSLFDEVSRECSKLITQRYSTSFSMGINFLHKKFHQPIYSIYGFVRFADEIVDSFTGYDQSTLIERFKKDTRIAIDEKISLNPVLNAFQHTVHNYGIGDELIDSFLHSMEMDLCKSSHDTRSYKRYILGSAEVVGLMCLKVFTENNDELYEKLKPGAMKLGSAFQKVNFLRDIKADYEFLGRIYFPGVEMENFSNIDKSLIETEIEEEFNEALIAIRALPASSRFGVYLAYKFYRKLFNKIKNSSADQVRSERIRISNGRKFEVLLKSFLRHQANIL